MMAHLQVPHSRTSRGRDIQRRLPSIDTKFHSRQNIFGGEQRRNSITSAGSVLSFSSTSSSSTAKSPLDPPTPPSLSPTEQFDFQRAEPLDVDPFTSTAAEQSDFSYDEAGIYALNSKGSDFNSLMLNGGWLSGQEALVQASLPMLEQQPRNFDPVVSETQNARDTFLCAGVDSFLPYGDVAWQIDTPHIPPPIADLVETAEPCRVNRYQSGYECVNEDQSFNQSQNNLSLPSTAGFHQEYVDQSPQTKTAELWLMYNRSLMSPFKATSRDVCESTLPAVPNSESSLGSPIVSDNLFLRLDDTKIGQKLKGLGSNRTSDRMLRSQSALFDPGYRVQKTRRAEKSLSKSSGVLRAELLPRKPKVRRTRSSTKRAQSQKRQRRTDNYKTENIESSGIILITGKNVTRDENGQLQKAQDSEFGQKFFCKMTFKNGDKCQKSFQRQEHLKRHMNSVDDHIEEKRFACVLDMCQKPFSRQDNRRQHYSTHMTPATQPRNFRLEDEALLFEAILADPLERRPHNTIAMLKRAKTKKYQEAGVATEEVEV